MVAIAVIVDGSSCGTEPTVPMAALLTVAVVDGGGNNGVFITASHNDNRHPCPHCPCPCPPSDKDWTAEWRARLVVGMVVVISSNFVSTRRTTAPRTTAAMTDKAITPISAAGRR